MEVPPPSAGHAEFVVLRARYDTAVRRCWEVGDQCQVGPEWVGGWMGGVLGRGLLGALRVAVLHHIAEAAAVRDTPHY